MEVLEEGAGERDELTCLNMVLPGTQSKMLPATSDAFHHYLLNFKPVRPSVKMQQLRVGG